MNLCRYRLWFYYEIVNDWNSGSLPKFIHIKAKEAQQLLNRECEINPKLLFFGQPNFIIVKVQFITLQVKVMIFFSRIWLDIDFKFYRNCYRVCAESEWELSQKSLIDFRFTRPLKICFWRFKVHHSFPLYWFLQIA